MVTGPGVTGPMVAGPLVVGLGVAVVESLACEVPVVAGEVARLVQAYRVAQAATERVRVDLGAAGIGAADVPGLCAGLDSAGAPVVVLGPMTTFVRYAVWAVLGPGRRRGGGHAA